MKRKRGAFSRENIRLRDAELKVPRKMEAYLLSVEERLRIQRLSELPESFRSPCCAHTQELGAPKLPREKLHPNVTEQAKNSGKPEGHLANDPKHRDLLLVIAAHERA